MIKISKFKMLAEEANKKSNSTEIMIEWTEILDYYLDLFKEKDEDIYCDLIEELFISIYGEHMNEELAEKAVSSMKNADGTKGEHWKIEDTTRQAEKFGVNWTNYNKYDFYYVMNMLYSDFYKLFKDDEETYTRMTIAWLDDKDVEPGKAYRYYKKVVK